jgi:hypothetical protein
VPVAVADAEPSEESVPYVSIILPCYNEEGHVTAEVERICAAMDTSGYSYEVLAIDDASTDQTLACLCEAASRFPNLEVVHFHRNGGSGVVRRIGTERARGQIFVWTDADMTDPQRADTGVRPAIGEGRDDRPGRRGADHRAGHLQDVPRARQVVHPQARPNGSPG